jgi:lipid A 3-O-deacylase
MGGSIRMHMRGAFVLPLLLTSAIASTALAQERPARDEQAAETERWSLPVGASEWMVTAGPAFGVSLFHSEPGHRYVLSSVSWGHVLTRPRGSGLFRGQFVWAFEGIPLFGQHSPDDTIGLGVTPIVWRWNFQPRGRVGHFAELAGGLLWTGEPVPRRTTTANFTAHIGYGVRYFVTPTRAFVAGYRFHHISNGNRLERNPGVNAHVMQFGFSLIR